MLQGLPWGVVVLDAHGTVLRLNEQAAHWWGVQPLEVLGKRLNSAIAGTLPADLLQTLQAVASGPVRPGGEFFLPEHQQWITMNRAQHGDGWVVYWQDVTAQKQQQQAHETQQAAHDLLRDVTAREQAAQTLLQAHNARARAAADKYGALYRSMDEGFCILEVLFDEAQRPVDYRFLEVNPAFEAQTGLREVVGKTMRELVPGTEVFSIEIHGRVARTGEPARFEGYAEALGRWFDVNSFPIGPAADRQVGVLFTDSSARKRAEEALRHSEARYRSLFSNMEQGFCLLEKLATAPGEPSDFRYLVVNPAFERHTGLADAAGRTIRELVPSFEPHIMAIYDEAVASGEPRRFEEYVVGRDIWFEAEVVPEAQPGHLAVLFSNVSARRLAEQNLRESAALSSAARAGALEAELRAVRTHQQLRQREREIFYRMFEQTPAVIALLRGPEHRIEFYNDAFQRLYPGRGELRGRLMDEVAPETTSQGFVDLLDGVYQTGETFYGTEVPLLMAQPGGQPPKMHYFNFTYQRFEEDGQPAGISVFAYDVAEQVLARRERETLQLRQQELFEQAPVAMGVFSGPDYVVEVCNPKLEAIWGRAAAEVLGRPLFEALPEVRDQGFRELLDGVRATGTPYVAREMLAWVLHHGELTSVYLDFVYHPLRDAQGTITAIAAVASDVSARKEVEAQLLAFNAGLERQVAERTRDLGESQARLQSVVDAVSTTVLLLRAVRDASGGILDFEYVLINPATQAYYPGQAVVGQRFGELNPGVRLTPIFGQLVAVVETGRRTDSEVHYTHEGLNNWFRLVGVKVGDGLLYTAEDITPRKRLEQAQTRSFALLQQSEAVAAMGSWDYDLGTHELTWSEGLYHLFGQPVGSPVSLQSFLDAVLDDDRPAAARLLRTVASGSSHFDAPLRLRVGDAVKNVRFKAVPIPDAPGVPERMLGVCLDVSDVQRLEAENLVLKLDRHKELLLGILQAQETERQRLAEVLHNGLGQVLYATKLHLDQLDTPALRALPALAGLHQQTDRLLADAMRQTRTLAHELVPTSLVEFGLVAAVRDVCRDLSTPQLLVECQIWGEELPLPQPVQVTLFRLVQELVHNIVRHAGATQALLELETLPGGVSLRAEDNGHGFDPRTVVEGLGLRTVRQAVALLGGTVAVDSSPEFGTHIRLRIPLPLFS
ncbi:PAS domain-containing protein [Hymenobacter sp. UYCo722]|uniref:PAS domain-containing protein n=1 Tax=Hymenobacter sp. UYCo722 TaxID=3156335 RepID=UPI0033996D35